MSQRRQGEGDSPEGPERREQVVTIPRSHTAPRVRESQLQDPVSPCSTPYYDPTLRSLAAVILDGAPDPMLVTDAEGSILLLNRAAETLFGYRRKELVGRPVEVLMPKRFRGAHGDHRRRFIEDPDVRGMGFRAGISGLRKDGTEFPADVSLSPQRYEDALMVTVAIRDVSVRRSVEERRRSLIDELRDALDQVRRLGELLPVCAWCERIGDDEGAWTRLESFFRAHAGAEVSHCICPECAEAVGGEHPVS